MMDHASRILNSTTRRQFLAAGVGAPLLLGMTRKARGLILPGGASSGGSLPDLSWSVTVSGSDKTSGAGWVSVVAFQGPTGSAYFGASSVQGQGVFPTSTTGIYYVYAERVGGRTGTCSATLSTADSLNAIAGTNYTAANQTLSWADGEIGWKRMAVIVTAIPTGCGFFWIKLSGTNPYRTVGGGFWLQGAGYPSGAKFAQTSNGTNVHGSTSGAGTSASPWVSLAYAIAQMGNAGGFLFVKQVGTGPHVEWSGTAGAGTGIQINYIACSDSSPLIILPDPGNTQVLEIDNGSTAGGSNIIYSNANALYFTGTGSGLFFFGLHCYRGNINFDGSSSYSHCMFWQCEVDNACYSGDDFGGIRADQTFELIWCDSYSHEHYSTYGGTSNPFTSVAAAFVPNWESFYAKSPCIWRSRWDLSQGVLFKQASNTTTDFTADVSHCLFLRFAQTNSGGGYAVSFPVQGTAWTGGATIRYSAMNGTSGIGQDFITNDSSVTTQNGPVYISNCISIAGSGFCSLTNVNGINIYDSICQDSSSSGQNISLGSPNSGHATQLEGMNNNLYVRGVNKWQFNYNAGTTIETSLAQWQAESPGAFFVNSPDPNSTSTSTTPAYANASAYNYRWTTDTGGLGGQPRGVGSQGVGIANNFLNSNLPVTA